MFTHKHANRKTAVMDFWRRFFTPVIGYAGVWYGHLSFSRLPEIAFRITQCNHPFGKNFIASPEFALRLKATGEFLQVACQTKNP